MFRRRPLTPEDFEHASGILRMRLAASRAKAFVPSPVELAAPGRYLKNLRFVSELRDENYTMLGSRRARTLIELARAVDRQGIQGAIVDCGVWNGGSTILMASASANREVWAFDSFEGMPKPGARDPDAHPDLEGVARGSEEILREGFERYAGDPTRLRIVKGWFDETLASAGGEIDPIALLHIDADWYDSVRLALETFYGRISIGGFVAVDDLRMWQGARDATMDFRENASIGAPIRSSHYWQKR